LTKTNSAGENFRPFEAMDVYMVELDKLSQHEEIDTQLLESIMNEIESSRILERAIVADKNTNIIVDGEHRYAALKRLGCRIIPVIYVDYNSPSILVQSWHEGKKLTKKDIIEAGLRDKKLPPKSSKHMIRSNNELLHISAIEEKVDAPLSMLKRGLTFVEMKDVKTAMQVELEDTLPQYSKFLSTELVDVPLLLDEKTNVLLVGYEAFQALDLLSVERAPALKADIEELKIKPAKGCSKPITKEVILNAGIKGPKLPPKSFEWKLNHTR